MLACIYIPRHDAKRRDTTRPGPAVPGARPLRDLNKTRRNETERDVRGDAGFGCLGSGPSRARDARRETRSGGGDAGGGGGGGGGVLVVMMVCGRLCAADHDRAGRCGAGRCVSVAGRGTAVAGRRRALVCGALLVLSVPLLCRAFDAGCSRAWVCWCVYVCTYVGGYYLAGVEPILALSLSQGTASDRPPLAISQSH